MDAPFMPGQSPSLGARRALLLMVTTAAAEGFSDKVYRLSKRELRQGHESNDRIGALVDEVISIRFQIPGLSSRGRAAIIKAHLFEEITEETDEGNSAWIEFEFSHRARVLFGASEVYAVLNRTAVLAFDGKYAITLYQLGCLYSGRRDPTIRLTVPELRTRLGVPEGRYSDWAQIRRFVLGSAKEEVDHLAHFQLSIREHREGRKVVAVTLGFWRKDDPSIDAAVDELDRSKVGRKARRTGTVKQAETRAANIYKELTDSLPGLDVDKIPEL
ncbi:replication initiation protein [Magnetospirillum molischianum]|uniref:replication initiation protein n=1 Tax=Magnetospirillum molischianum TaxID=1083 RepID=UPI00138AD841|nr:replication initiation protein [Magnetospirillum molischianum]